MTAALVTLNADLYERFHGERPPYRIRGVAVVADGEPVAVGGIGFHGVCLEVFMDMRESAPCYPKLLLRGGREVIRMAREYNLPALAVRNEELDSAPRFLSRLGFVPDGDVWRLHR